ncbi:RNA polymerase sigma factor [Enhygromyxa salina]|uniref:RNA polymerase sigma factor n=1 Tax=Enhygromyxa salina TaxID=215803 RepID=UPI0011BAA874|nr:sigma factor-like helix-turn-helix DNA-binding protein [Enhygromyxa salina]
MSLLDDDEPEAEGSSPCGVLLMLADLEVLDRAVAQVDEVYRDVVRMSLTGRDNRQIAAELAIPYNTVRSRLGRGRMQVVIAARAALEEEGTGAARLTWPASRGADEARGTERVLR